MEIEVAGPAESVRDFIGSISSESPPLARIVKVETTDLPYRDIEEFQIISSRALESRSTLISPDVCTCRDCLRELLDPRDRRFRYPFINCTNCGPRYTIIKDIPYDRDKTTMAHFKMCPRCRREYDDPLDRRFHAQPNACWECGPQVWLEDAQGNRIAARDEAVVKTVALLDAGSILAIKGLGGFHLAVKATREAAVSPAEKPQNTGGKALCGNVSGTRGHQPVLSPERPGRKAAEKPGSAHRTPGEALQITQGLR